VVVEVEAAGAEVGADVARDDEGDEAGCSCGESSTWKHWGKASVSALDACIAQMTV
jgi:hypothetical protein